jgi:hypothetical protein
MRNSESEQVLSPGKSPCKMRSNAVLLEGIVSNGKFRALVLLYDGSGMAQGHHSRPPLSHTTILPRCGFRAVGFSRIAVAL